MNNIFEMTEREEKTLKRLFDRTLHKNSRLNLFFFFSLFLSKYIYIYIYIYIDECGPIIWTIRNSTVAINLSILRLTNNKLLFLLYYYTYFYGTKTASLHRKRA